MVFLTVLAGEQRRIKKRPTSSSVLKEENKIKTYQTCVKTRFKEWLSWCDTTGKLIQVEVVSAVWWGSTGNTVLYHLLLSTKYQRYYLLLIPVVGIILTFSPYTFTYSRQASPKPNTNLSQWAFLQTINSMLIRASHPLSLSMTVVLDTPEIVLSMSPNDSPFLTMSTAHLSVLTVHSSQCSQSVSQCSLPIPHNVHYPWLTVYTVNSSQYPLPMAQNSLPMPFNVHGSCSHVFTHLAKKHF